MIRLIGALAVFAILFLILLLGLHVAEFMGHSFTSLVEPVWRWFEHYLHQHWGKALIAALIGLLVTWRLFASSNRHDRHATGAQQPVIPPKKRK